MLKLIIFAACMAALLIGAESSGKAPSGGAKSRRKWSTDFCVKATLEKHSKSKGKKAAFMKSALAQINKLSATELKALEDAVKAKSWSNVAPAVFDKIPEKCLMFCELDGITVDQLKKSAAKGDIGTVEDGAAKLSTADKATLLQALMNVVAEDQDDSVSRAVGKASLTEVIAKASDAKCGCHFIYGALMNTALTKTQYTTLMTSFSTKKCYVKLADNICYQMAAVAVRLYKGETDAKVIVQKLKNLFQCMDSRLCHGAKKIFENSFKTAQGVIDLKLDEIRWQQSKCPDKRRTGHDCVKAIGQAFHKNCKSQTPASFKSLGVIGSAVSIGCIKKLSGGDCKALEFYKLYSYKGAAIDSQLRKEMQSCIKKLGVTDGSTISTLEKAKELGAYIPFLPKEVIEAIPKAHLCARATIDLCKEYLQYGRSGQAIKNKCERNWDISIPKQESCGSDGGEGKRKKNPTMTRKERQDMPADEAVALCEDDNTRHEVANQYDSDACAIVKKCVAKKRSTLTKICKDKSLSKCFDMNEFVSSVTSIKDLSGLQDCKLTGAQKAVILKKVITLKPLDQLTAKDIMFAAKVLARAFSPEHIVALKNINAFTGIAKVFRERVGEIRGKTMKAILSVCNESLAADLSDDESDAFATMDPKQATFLGQLISYIPEIKSLEKAQAAVKAKYCEQMANHRLEAGNGRKCRKLPDLNRLWKLCRATVTTSGTLTADNLASLGLLSCFITKGDLEKVANSDVHSATSTIFKRCEYMDPAVGKLLVEKVFKHIGKSDVSKLTDDELSAVGAVLKFDAARLDKLPSAKLPLVSYYKKIDKKCFDRMYKQIKAVNPNNGLKLGLVKLAAGSIGKLERRRRSTTATYTFNYLNPLQDDFIVALFKVVSEFSKISNDDLKSLVKKFGEIDGWSKEQRDEYTKRLKVAMSKTSFCTFTLNELRDSGVFVASMTDAEIDCMDLSGDKAAPLISVTAWTEGQFVKLAAKYMKSKSLSASTLTGDQISDLGSFMCGLSDADIAKIQSANFKDAISKVQQKYINCPKTKLSALLQLSIKSYGSIDTWSTATIQEVGSVIIGINEAQIKSLGVKVAVVNDDYLKKMDRKVLDAMTPEGKAALDDEVREELFPSSSTGGGGGGGSSGGGKDVKDSSAAATPLLNTLLITITMMVLARQA